jgi:hypothetical protein
MLKQADTGMEAIVVMDTDMAMDMDITTDTSLF